MDKITDSKVEGSTEKGDDVKGGDMSHGYSRCFIFLDAEYLF